MRISIWKTFPNQHVWVEPNWLLPSCLQSQWILLPTYRYPSLNLKPHLWLLILSPFFRLQELLVQLLNTSQFCLSLYPQCKTLWFKTASSFTSSTLKEKWFSRHLLKTIRQILFSRGDRQSSTPVSNGHREGRQRRERKREQLPRRARKVENRKQQQQQHAGRGLVCVLKPPLVG